VRERRKRAAGARPGERGPLKVCDDFGIVVSTYNLEEEKKNFKEKVFKKYSPSPTSQPRSASTQYTIVRILGGGRCSVRSV
jgi:hypothetical protein